MKCNIEQQHINLPSDSINLPEKITELHIIDDSKMLNKPTVSLNVFGVGFSYTKSVATRREIHIIGHD